MATWPATLPQVPQRDGYQETFANTSISTSMDVGPPKTRRRVSYGTSPTIWPLKLTSAEVEVLRTFYQDTLASGSLSFTHKNPRTKASKSYKIISAPSISPVGTRFAVNLNIEEQP